jgi:DNA-binding transcriptional LysR family regulator
MTQIGPGELKAFVEVARRGSFRAAADMLGVSRSSLSHAMRSLEERMGVRLLHRTTRSVSPTEAGARLLRGLPHALQGLDDLLESVRHGPDAVTGTLRINTERLAGRWLIRRVVPTFLSAHPRVTLDLVGEGRFVDIVGEGFDAGVRLADSVPQDMVAVPFGDEIRFRAVASPAYLEARGRPVTPHDLMRHDCIRQRLPSGKRYLWQFARGTEEITLDVPGPLTLNDNGLMRDAALEGLGVALLPEPAISDALSNGRLLPVLEDWTPPDPPPCLYYPGRRLVPPPLRAFITVLKDVARRERVARPGAT